MHSSSQRHLSQQSSAYGTCWNGFLMKFFHAYLLSAWEEPKSEVLLKFCGSAGSSLSSSSHLPRSVSVCLHITDGSGLNRDCSLKKHLQLQNLSGVKVCMVGWICKVRSPIWTPGSSCCLLQFPAGPLLKLPVLGRVTEPLKPHL